ncbi:hypothetical protein LTR64_003997 [Lithohypha guttulata]|uniref:uncharacterized protein n=1 Tax=Lithohypha guttulata TaxID=1690604 RepID=UPI00315C9E5D
MHTLPHPTIQIATILVGDAEVPLSLYWQAVDLWEAGHSSERIVVHIVATRNVSNLAMFRETIQHIVYNQELIKRSTIPAIITNTNPGMRRNSRIENVDELDNLDVADKVAQRREKEKLGLKQLIARLG